MKYLDFLVTLIDFQIYEIKTLLKKVTHFKIMKIKA